MNRSEELRKALIAAERARESGEDSKAVRILQDAATRASIAENPDSGHERLHGEICLRLAGLLEDADRLPESMQAYQEAADSYGRAPGSEAEASFCARKIVSGVKEMWRRPDRLYLLIARIDRERRQLDERPGSEIEPGRLALP